MQFAIIVHCSLQPSGSCCSEWTLCAAATSLLVVLFRDRHQLCCSVMARRPFEKKPSGSPVSPHTSQCVRGTAVRTLQTSCNTLEDWFIISVHCSLFIVWKCSSSSLFLFLFLFQSNQHALVHRQVSFFLESCWFTNVFGSAVFHRVTMFVCLWSTVGHLHVCSQRLLIACHTQWTQ